METRDENSRLESVDTNVGEDAGENVAYSTQHTTTTSLTAAHTDFSTPVATAASSTVTMVPTNWTKGDLLGAKLYSKVFLCNHDQQNGRQLAVKQITSFNPTDSLNVEKKIQLLKDLQHEHIVQYYGSERSDKHISIFMECMLGGSLYQYLQQHGPLEEQLGRRCTRQLLEGIEYLHNKGIIHGRMKCTQLLRDSSGNIKITDYGLHKELHFINLNNSEHTGCMVADGYWHWRPPEVLLPSGTDVDRVKVDVWSIGCTVIEMLTGHPPYHDLSLFAGVSKIITEPMTNNLPSHSSSECTHSFLQYCLSRDVASRPTVSDLLKHEFINVSTTSDGAGSGESRSSQAS